MKLFYALAVLTLSTSAAHAGDQSKYKPTPAKAKQDAVRLLNEKSNMTRMDILKARAENCFALSSECGLAQEELENNSHVFTADEILTVAFQGTGWEEDPCKFENCDGEDRELQSYVVLVKSANVARWARTPAVITAELNYVKSTSQKDGSVKNSIEFYAVQNQVPSEPLK